MKISNAFPSKYIKAADLQDRNVTLIISHVEMEDIGDSDKKPVLHFMKTSKGLVLNRTNSKVIVNSYGDDTESWSGKQLILFPALVDFRGDQVEAIRVRIPKPAAPPKPAPKPTDEPIYDERNPPPLDDDELNDEVPF